MKPCRRASPTTRALFALACIAAAAAEPTAGAEAPIPHLGPRGHADFAHYRQLGLHKSFVIAPGGAWAWVDSEASAELARQRALEACAGHTEQTCIAWETDGQSVFDAKAWPTLLGPYPARLQAGRAAVGTARGQRFPELALTDVAGRPHRLSEWRGKVVVLHFWGSWCAPCRHEMPDLQALRDSLRDRRDIVFVLAQVREAFPASQRWAARQQITLPLFDSGSTGLDDEWLRLADGRRIGDREVAGQFPTTTLIDKHGIVLLTHVGPVPRWSEYRDFLLDAARRSGK